MAILSTPVPRHSSVTELIRRQEPDADTQLLIIALELRLLSRALGVETSRPLLDRRVGMARMEELAAMLERLTDVRASSAAERQPKLINHDA